MSGFRHGEGKQKGTKKRQSAYKVLQTTIPDFLVNARLVDATVEDASNALLAGEVSVVDVKTKASNDDYHKNKSPVGAKQDEISVDYWRRAKRVGGLLSPAA